MHNVLFEFHVTFDNGDYFYRYSPDHFTPIRDGGRTKNTRDEWDVEKCVYIPIDYFEEL